MQRQWAFQINPGVFVLWDSSKRTPKDQNKRGEGCMDRVVEGKAADRNTTERYEDRGWCNLDLVLDLALFPQLFSDLSSLISSADCFYSFSVLCMMLLNSPKGREGGDIYKMNIDRMYLCNSLLY